MAILFPRTYLGCRKRDLVRLDELRHTMQRVRLIQQRLGQRLREFARDGLIGKLVSELT